MPLIDGVDIIDRQGASYGIDTRARGHAATPWSRGRRSSAARSSRSIRPRRSKVPGVLKVVAIDRARRRPPSSSRSAASPSSRGTPGRRSRVARPLKIEWDDGPNAAYDSAAYRPTLEKAARGQPGRSCATKATLPGRWRRRNAGIEAEYYLPHLAHATMEPPAATARIADGRCEVWACDAGARRPCVMASPSAWACRPTTSR